MHASITYNENVSHTKCVIAEVSALAQRAWYYMVLYNLAKCQTCLHWNLTLDTLNYELLATHTVPSILSKCLDSLLIIFNDAYTKAGTCNIRRTYRKTEVPPVSMTGLSWYPREHLCTYQCQAHYSTPGTVGVLNRIIYIAHLIHIFSLSPNKDPTKATGGSSGAWHW